LSFYWTKIYPFAIKHTKMNNSFSFYLSVQTFESIQAVEGMREAWVGTHLGMDTFKRVWVCWVFAG